MQVGIVKETFQSGKESAHFEWQIDSWRMRSCVRRKFHSVLFSFAGVGWWLEMKLNRGDFIFSDSDSDAPGDLPTNASISLTHSIRASIETVSCWLGVRKANGEEEELGNYIVELKTVAYPSWTMYDLMKPEKQLVSSADTMTILVRLNTVPTIARERMLEKRLATCQKQLQEYSVSRKILKRQISELEENLNSVTKRKADLQKEHNLSILELQRTKKANEILNQKNKNLVKERKGHVKELNDLHVLQEHLKVLHSSANDHDILLRVKTKEFRAHKNVLCSRSPVFEAMFKHGTKESIESTVDITDCDPDCFGEFLQYIYTGQVDNLSPSNVLGLYYASHKYDFPLLRSKCVDFLKTTLSSPQAVGDVINLADTYQDQELKDCAVDYVVNMMR